MSLETIVQVNISKETKAPSQAGFGVPAVLSKEAALLASFSAARVKTYEPLTALASMVTDGFTTADQTYKAVSAIIAQSPRVQFVKIIRQAVSVAQVDTVTVDTIIDATTYVTTINGIPYSFISGVGATDVEIVTGLRAAIDAGTEPITTGAGAGTDDYVITADNAGQGFSNTVDANQSVVKTTANLGPVEEIISARDEDDDWYFLGQAPYVTLETKLLAAYVETTIKLFGYQTDDATSKSEVEAVDGTSLMQVLKDLGYERTFGVWTATAKLSEYKIMAWIGKMAPKDPGSATWKFKQGSGISVDSYATQEKLNISAKNGNTFTLVAGFNIFEEGKCASGEFIDIMRGIDWMTARIQENVFGLLVTEDKVPYDDGGIETVGLQVDEIGKQAETKKVIVTDTFLTTVPLRENTTTVDRANRILRDVNFTGDLAGAIHFTVINGTVTV